jgi:hypothetical protein
VSLLRPKAERNLGGSKLPEYRTLRCPFNGHQASWCRQLCEPYDGRGVCGRPATHGMHGKTQIAIARYRERTAAVTLPDR